jgi:transposase
MPSELERGTRAKIRHWQDVPGPKLQQVKMDPILVLDNLRPHHAAEVRELLDQAGIGLVHLPRYSPEFNAIEHAWAQMKERLKAKAARSLATLGRNSNQPSTLSPHRTPEAGSGMPVMLYNDLHFALAE